MIHNAIELLNDQVTPFEILNLHEEMDVDYILVAVNSIMVAVKVCYGDEISFERISPEKRKHILDSLVRSSESCTKAGLHEEILI